MGSVSPEPKQGTRSRNDCFSPPVDSFWLVRWFHLHCFKPFFRSLCKATQTSDLANVGEELYPQNCIKGFQETAQAHPDASFGSIIFRHMMLLPLLNSAAIAVITAALAMSGPLLIKQILTYLKSNTSTVEQQQRAYWMAGGIVIAYFFKAILSENALRLAMGVSVRVGNIISLSVYDKLISVSKCYGRFMTEGDYMSHLDTDQKVIVTFIRSIPNLSQSITTFLLAQILLCLEVGVQGLSLLAIIAISFAVQLLMDRKQASLKLGKLQLYKERIIENIHFYSQLKRIKCLGWQEIIPLRNHEIRQKQNIYNLSNWMYANMYSVVANFAPIFIVLIILLIDVVLFRQEFNYVTAFTVVAYTNMLFTPITTLPTTIILGIQAKTACFRLNHLFKSQQRNDKRSANLKQGEIIINNLQASWETEDSNIHYKDHSRQYVNNSFYQKQGVQSSQINLRVFNKQQTKTNPVKIAFKIELKQGEKLIILGDVNSGKTTFLQAILGTINQIEGSIQYGGKIGYIAQIVVLNRESIRNNILFGEPFQEAKYKKIVRMVGLDKWIEQLNTGDESVLSNIQQTAGLAQKKKIHLARALYQECNIIILDQFFCDIDPDSVSSIIDNFSKAYPNVTLIISTSETSFIKPTDKVLTISKGVAIEYGASQDLFKQLNSCSISYLKSRQSYGKSLRKKTSIQDPFSQSEVFTLINLLKTSKNDTLDILAGAFSEDTIKFPGNRPPGVDLKYYCKFFKSANPCFFIWIWIFFTLGQAANIASVWWIGSMSSQKLPFEISSHNQITVYVILVIGYGFFLLIAGLLIPFLSIESTQTIGTKITNLIKTSEGIWFGKQGQNFLNQFTNRDYEEIFTISQFIQRIYCNTLIYIGTIILAGQQYPILLILGAVAIAVNIFLLAIYVKIQREYFYIWLNFHREYYRLFEDCIRGEESIKCYRKQNYYRQHLCDILYKTNAVCQINDRYIIRAMTVLSEITSIGIIFGISAFAIGFKKEIDILSLPIIGSAISLSNKLTGLGNNILKDSAGLQIQLRSTIMIPFANLQFHQEQNYQEPAAPVGWPIKSNISLRRVSYSHPFFKEPVLKELQLELPSKLFYSIIDLSGGVSIESLFLILNKIRQLTPNEDGTVGIVSIGGHDISKIGRKYVKNAVMMLDSIPFILKGTVRDNIDPFNQFTDEKIKQVLTKLRFWEADEENEIMGDNILNQNISEFQGNLSHGKKQILNLARAVLKQPSIILANYTLSSVQESIKKHIFKNLPKLLPNSTIIVATANIDTYLTSDKVIILEDGCLLEFGRPKDLLLKSRSKLNQVIKKINPSFEIKILDS